MEMLIMLFLVCSFDFCIGFALGYYFKACNQRKEEIEKLAQDLEPTLEELARQKGIRLNLWAETCREAMYLNNSNSKSIT